LQGTLPLQIAAYPGGFFIKEAPADPAEQDVPRIRKGLPGVSV